MGRLSPLNVPAAGEHNMGQRVRNCIIHFKVEKRFNHWWPCQCCTSPPSSFLYFPSRRRLMLTLMWIISSRRFSLSSSLHVVLSLSLSLSRSFCLFIAAISVIVVLASPVFALPVCLAVTLIERRSAGSVYLSTIPESAVMSSHFCSAAICMRLHHNFYNRKHRVLQFSQVPTASSYSVRRTGRWTELSWCRMHWNIQTNCSWAALNWVYKI